MLSEANNQWNKMALQISENIRRGRNPMAEVKSYPQFSTFQTSTVLSCAQCKSEIKMYTPVVTDGKSYWHADCKPSQVEPSEVHTVESPFVAKDEEEPKGE